MNNKVKAVASSIAVSLMFGIFACSSDNKPTPLPTTPAPSVSESVEITEAPTPPQITRNGSGPATIEPDETERPPAVPNEPKPTTVAPTTSAAVPPGVAFAQRWGKQYPGVPEFAILKAANATCRLIADSGTNWNDNTETMSAIADILKIAGVNSSDALEFAQDADQNYCASVSNPT